MIKDRFDVLGLRRTFQDQPDFILKSSATLMRASRETMDRFVRYAGNQQVGHGAPIFYCPSMTLATCFSFTGEMMPRSVMMAVIRAWGVTSKAGL